ncbi:hypothetical protein E3226_004200 [Legionella geestiana]|uniref:hypothetical protein n=1 Tax=Legionella geestiana TaxID=45065 RepID=UPI0010930273|nr:hypothetical protein [Legionella geestiana]QDQ39657.1 hypothetical protein E3226_004200 [Legionella geestiana]
MSATPTAIKPFTVDFSWQSMIEQAYQVFLCVNGQRSVRLLNDQVSPILPESCSLKIKWECRLQGFEISSDKNDLKITHPLYPGDLTIEVVEMIRTQRIIDRSATFFAKTKLFALDTTQFEPGKHHKVLIKEEWRTGISTKIQSVGDARLIYRPIESIDDAITVGTEISTLTILLMSEHIARWIQTNCPEALTNPEAIVNLQINIGESRKQTGVTALISTTRNIQRLDALRMDYEAFMKCLVTCITAEKAEAWISAVISQTLPDKSQGVITRASSEIVKSMQEPSEAPAAEDGVVSSCFLP